MSAPVHPLDAAQVLVCLAIDSGADVVQLEGKHTDADADWLVVAVRGRQNAAAIRAAVRKLELDAAQKPAGPSA